MSVTRVAQSAALTGQRTPLGPNGSGRGAGPTGAMSAPATGISPASPCAVEELRRARKRRTGGHSARGLALWIVHSTPRSMAPTAGAGEAGIGHGDDGRRRRLRAVIGDSVAVRARGNYVARRGLHGAASATVARTGPNGRRGFAGDERGRRSSSAAGGIGRYG